MDYPFREINCELCGKKFIPAVEHIFKETRKGKPIWFCGYNCQCNYDRENPRTKGGRWKSESKHSKDD